MASGRPPVHDYDFPDPEVIRVGSTYYAYSTNVLGFWGSYVNLPVLESTDLESWTLVADGLRYSNSVPSYGSWVDQSKEGYIWAPGVEQFGSAFVVYYTAPHAASGKQCVGRAVSSSPTGPFIDNTSAPLKCQTSEGGTIDADTYRDGGTTWLLFKNDGNCCGQPVHLWAQKLTSDGLSLIGSASKILSFSQAWEYPLIEQPAMVDGPGGRFLFYSGNWWESANYAIGYAKCSSVVSCSKKTLSGPWMSSTTYAKGPGAADFFTDPLAEQWFTYHGWSGGTVGYPFGRRAMFLEAASLNGSTPTTNSGYPYPVMDPNGLFQPVATNVIGSYDPLVGNFAGTADDDIFWYGPGSTSDTLWISDGDGTFTGIAKSVIGTYTPLVGDFGGSSYDDIFWYRPGSGADYLWLANGDGSFTSTATSVGGTYEPLIGNFTGTDHEDIFWYRPGGGADYLWSADGDGTFTSTRTQVTGTYEPLIGDFAGTANDDIYWYRSQNGTDPLWTSNGAGSFSTTNTRVSGAFMPLVGMYGGSEHDDVFWYQPGSGLDSVWLAIG